MTTRPTLLRTPFVLLPTLALALGCADDESTGDDEIGDSSSSTGDGDGDGDSESSDSGESTETESESSTDTTDTSTDTTDTTDTGTETTTETTDEGTFCEPGETVCEVGGVATCLMDGSAFGDPVACDDTEECVAGTCQELCVSILASPSSIGCSFFAHKMDNYTAVMNPQPEPPDSFVVGNVSPDLSATVQLYYMPVGSNVEQPDGNAVVIPPGGTQSFEMDALPIESVSLRRVGGTYRIQSDIPVVAYLHSPLQEINTNDASMLLPEHALRENHIVAAYYPWLTNYYPSYFNVIASEDGTTVNWTPPVNTSGGTGVGAVTAGQTGQVILNRGDTLQVVAANHVDVSGTFVTADKPIAVLSGNEIVNVPQAVLNADHIEEQMLPLDYWGEEYVGPTAPPRGSEGFHWRVFGGADNVTVSVSPNQPGFPINLTQGEWFEFETLQNVVFTGNGPFMPVQYLEGNAAGAGSGDPSMYQMVPTEQFLDAYTFTTGIGYDVDYVQVIREMGGAEVYIDGNQVGLYFNVGNYQVSNVSVSEGNHYATSAEPFGIIQIGYSNVTSYAYPGGLQLAVINPQ